MANHNLRILLETVEGVKTSYIAVSGSTSTAKLSGPPTEPPITASFINTSEELVLSSSQAYHRITGSVSCSYQNQTNFNGSFNTGSNLTFKNNNLLSASLSGSANFGIIEFIATDTQYDRLKRYKFFGDKVCNTLGLTPNQWIYVDQARFPADDELNYFEGNVNANTLHVTDNLSFSPASNITSHLTFFNDTGSDKFIRFVDERTHSNTPIQKMGMFMGYNESKDQYEIGSDITSNINHPHTGLFLRGISEISSSTSAHEIKMRAESFELEQGSANSSVDIQLTQAGNSTRILQFKLHTDGDGEIRTLNNNSDLKLRTDDFNNAVYIDDSTERVGIGDASPASKLQIAGDLTVDSDITGSLNISASGYIQAKHLILSGGSGVFTSASLAAGGGGGSTNAAGSDTQVQFNDGGTNFGGDAGLVYNKSTDTLTAVNISATTFNTTHFTSSFITSSTIVTEGSNTFGDTIADQHTFNGNITASNSISASGGMFGPAHYFTSNTTDDYILFHKGSDAILIQSQDININGANGVGIGTGVATNNDSKLHVHGDMKVNSHITASANISASLTSTGSFGRVEAITTLSAEHLESTDDLFVTDTVTIGGDVVFGTTSDHAIGINQPGGNTAGRKLALSASNANIATSGNFKGGNVELQGGAGVGSGDDGYIILNGREGNVGIGTFNPTKELQVTGDISASGTIFATAVGGDLPSVISGSSTALSSSISNRVKTLEGNFVATAASISGSSTALSSSIAEDITEFKDGTITLISGSSTSTGSFGMGLFSNKIGIGLSNPSTPLHIKSAGESTGGIRFQNTHDTVNMFFVGDDDDEGFQITYVGTGGAEIELQADGDLLLNASNGDNVAIGNTSPTAKLDITGDLRVSTNITANGNISASLTSTASFGRVDAIGVISADDLNVTDDLSVGGDSNIGTLLNFKQNNQAVIKVLGASGGNVHGVDLIISGASGNTEGSARDGGDIILHAGMKAAGNDGNVIINPNQGKVGIATSNPTKELQVTGDISASGTIFATTVGGDLPSVISGSLGTNADLIRSLTAVGISGSSTALSSSISDRVKTLEANGVFTAAGISGSITEMSTSIASRTTTLEGNFVATAASISGSSTALSSSISDRVKTLEANGVFTSTSISGSSTALSSSISDRVKTLEANGVFTSTSISGSSTALSSSIASDISEFKDGTVTLVSGSSVSTASFGNVIVGNSIHRAGDNDTHILFTDDDINIRVGGMNMVDFSEGGTDEITFNETAQQLDVRIEGEADPNLLFTDAVNNKVGIGTNKPTKKLQVTGEISSSGNITTEGTITAEQITSTDDLSVAGDSNIGTLLNFKQNNQAVMRVLGASGGNVHGVDLIISGANANTEGSARDGGDVIILSGRKAAGNDGNIILNPHQGLVGIGTSNPTKALQVTGDISASGTMFAHTGSFTHIPTINGITTFTAAGNLDIGPYNFRARTLQSDVGTGTVPISISSTTKVTNLNADLLDDQEGSHYLDFSNFVVDDDEISGDKIEGGTIGSVTITDLTATKLNVTHFTSSFITASIIQTEGSNTFGDTIADTHTFTGHITASANISASGTGSFGAGYIDNKLGIGTTSPAHLLHIFADNSSEEPLLKVENDGTGDASIRFHLTGTENYTMGIDNNDSNKFKIAKSTALSSTPRLTIDSSGNVGIGTTTPTKKLQVEGDISASGTIFATTIGGSLPSVISGSSTALSSSLAGRTTTLEGNLNATSITGSSTALSASISDRVKTLEGNVGQAVNTTSDVTFDDITANGNIVGDNSTNISGINNITAAGTTSSSKFSATGTDSADGEGGTGGYRFRNRADTGIYERNFSTAIMAPEYVVVSIDSNNNNNFSDGTPPSFCIIHDTGSLGHAPPDSHKLFEVKESGITTFQTASNIGVTINHLGGHITASGDISSSGTVTVQNLNVFSPAGNIKIGENVAGNLDGIAIEKNITASMNLYLEGDIRDVNNITASGNISGSVTSTGSFGRIDVTGVLSADDLNVTDDLTVGDDLSVSGDSNIGTLLNLKQNNEATIRVLGASGGNVHGVDLIISGANANTEGSARDGGDIILHAGMKAAGSDGNVIINPNQGLVGIGTSNPPEELTVQGNISASGVMHSPAHYFTAGTADDYILYLAATDSMEIKSQDININPGNGVGIGTGLATNNDSKLHVYGDMKVTSHITASANISASGKITANEAQFGSDSVHINGTAGQITASGNISASGGTFLGKQRHITWGSYNDANASEENFVGIMGYPFEGTSINYYRQMIAPYNGKIVKAVVHTNSSNVDMVLKLYADGSVVGTTPSTAIGRNQSSTFTDFTAGASGTGTFAAGDLLAVSMTPDASPGDINFCFVWEFNVAE
tara:strand:+ start:680 stop:7774 length:7095 start_codon:yes stop_codon:yes gene_type:complete